MVARYELVIIWDTGEKEVIPYSTEDKAKEIERGYHRAFGKQIQWTGIREVR